MQNVRVLYHNVNSVAAHWETDEARYHVYLEDGQPRGPIYKNALVDYKQPGYFHTRQLNAFKKANAWLVEEIMRAIRDGDMINKAKSEYDAAQLAERKAQDEAIKLNRNACELFQTFHLIITGQDQKPYYTLTHDDMKALLSYAPKHGNDDA